MFKQFGISSVELLISLSIVSSLTAFTLSLAEEVEKSAKEYQQETNVKEMLKKIRSGKKVP
jgi:type II secretory pathway pseudopilin PulG